MKVTNVYFDASALLPLFIDDEFTPAAKVMVSRVSIVHVSDWTTAECVSAIGRAIRMGLLTHERARGLCGSIDAWVFANALRIDVEVEDVRFAESLLRRFEFNLRAPDALHVALARRLSLPLATFDRNMAICAEALGLQLARP